MASDGNLNFDTKIDESGFNKGIKNIGSLGKTALTVVGGTLVGITSAIGTGIAASVKVGSAFEAEMSKVSAISGATGDELGLLGEKAKEMGSKTKFSATESAQAMEYMAMAGWKTEDMLSGIEGVMNLAAASGEDLATTSDIVTDALTAFGMAASDSSHFADVLAAVSSNANTNVGLMGETFKYVAPVAGALGYSAEDTALAIGLMANSGIKASQAGTSLRHILSRMVSPTDEVQDAMDRLGISMTDSHGNAKSLDAVMGELRNSFDGLSEAEKAQMASAIGGQEAMSGLLAIVNASDEDFDSLRDSIYNCDGAAADMAATMQDNLQGQLTILKSSAEGLGIEIYESIETPLKDLAKVGIESVNSLTNAFKDDGVNGLIEAGSKIVANIVVGIVSNIPKVTSMALHVCGSIINAIGDSAPQLTAAGNELIQFLIDGMDQLSDSAPEIAEQAAEIVSNLMSGIEENAPQLLTAGVNMLSSFVQGIAQQLPQLVPQALQMVATLANSIISNLPTIINAGISLLKGLVQGIINSIPILVSEGPRIINDFTNAIYSGIGNLILAGLQMIQSLAQGLWENKGVILENAGQILLAIINVFSLSKLFSLGQSLVNSMSSGLKSLGGNITAAGKELLTKLVSGIKSLATHPVTTLKNIATNAMNAIKNVNWGSVGKGIIDGIVNGLKASAKRLVEAAAGAAADALNWVKNKLGIHSPSTVFRDQVGKMMALGIGVGFEKNIPTKAMNAGLQKAVNSLKKDVIFTTSARSGKTVGEIKNNPGFNQDPGTDWDEWERRQRRLNKERDSRPIFLDSNRIDRPLPKGAVPVW